MWLRLRQVALLATDIQPVIDDLKAVFGLEVGYVDPHLPPAYGLQNRLLPVGIQFIEIVSPIREETAGGRYLERRGGDGGYMVITQADDHAPRKARVAELGIRAVAARDDKRYCLMQLHPQDTGGSFLEIDWHEGADDPVPGWSHAAADDWQHAIRTDRVTAIAAVEIQSPDPAKVAARWTEIIEEPIAVNANGNPSITLDNATIRFVTPTDGRPEGLGGVDLKAAAPDAIYSTARARGLLREDGAIVIAGTRFRLV